MDKTNKTIGLLALSGIKGIGPAFIKKIISNDIFSTPNIAEEIKDILLSSKKEVCEDEVSNQVDKAEETIFRCNRENVKIISIIDDNYPSRLKAIKDPPAIIYCKGNIELLKKNTICIIGTREPNENGMRIAERVGAYYFSNQWTVCNGLAEGVDNHSIMSIDKNYSNVIGVMSGGLNYNQRNTLLKKTAENAEKVLRKGGLLISEMSLDKKEDTFSVIKSCRIQAGVSNGLLLIQSPLDGGSRFTAKAFCELPRPLAIISPIQSDFDLPKYNANVEIIKKHKIGLSAFAEIKLDKIYTSDILIIKSKNDYSKFEELMLKQIECINSSKITLFD